MSNSWSAPDPDPTHPPEPQSWPAQQPEPTWDQPPFAPGYAEPQRYSYAPPPPQPPPAVPAAVSGSVLIPGGSVPPAGMLESTLRVIAGLIWPLVIAVLIFGSGSWWGGIIFAIIASTLLRNVTRTMRQRRIQDARVVPPPSDPPWQDLR